MSQNPRTLPGRPDSLPNRGTFSPGLKVRAFTAKASQQLADWLTLENIPMFHRLFIAHPRTVDESYGEHFAFAGRFGLTMIRGGLCALVHALVPGWCITTGSDTIVRLNRIMVEQRRALGRPVRELPALDWVI